MINTPKENFMSDLFKAVVEYVKGFIAHDYATKIEVDKIKDELESDISGGVKRFTATIEETNGSISSLSEEIRNYNRERSIELEDTYAKVKEAVEPIQKLIDEKAYVDYTDKKVSLVLQIIEALKGGIKELKAGLSKLSSDITSVTKRVANNEQVIPTLAKKVEVPKEVDIKSSKGIGVVRDETNERVTFYLTNKSPGNIAVLKGSGTATTTSAGSTNYAGLGIDITGLTITNTLPGVSLQAGNGVVINGVTISATAMGSSADDIKLPGGSGYYECPGWLINSQTTRAVSTANIFYQPVFVPYTTAYNQIAVEVTTQGQSGSKLILGLYGSTYGIPYDRIVASTGLTLETTGVVSFGTSVQLSRGLYYIAYKQVNGTATYRGANVVYKAPVYGVATTFALSSSNRIIPIGADTGATIPQTADVSLDLSSWNDTRNIIAMLRTSS